MQDICIIGGGASGMAAGIAAASENPSLKICILEKKESPGKKLAATGNGKCNLTNASCAGVKETLEFFSSMGIITRTDEQGRVYPYSQQASDLVYGMLAKLEALGVEIKARCTVEKIIRIQGKFTVIYNGKEKMDAKKLLLATGGKAAPQFGSSGDGYAFAKAMGHAVTRLSPVLTALEADQDFRPLKGIRTRAVAGLLKDDKLICEEEGEVQFTADGISGICIFDLSRFVKIAPEESFREGIARYQVCLDFLPHMTFAQTEDFLRGRSRLAGLGAEDLLLSIVPKALAARLLEESGFAGKAADSEAVNAGELARRLKGWKIGLSGVKGWKTAQCTSGGVDLSQIESATMESRLKPGLYFCGEILDYDGPCGGFNLQHAWETGIKAGKAMAVSEQNQRA